MAAKRLSNDYSDENGDEQNQRRVKNKPCFASVIKEAVMVNFLDNVCSSLEPMLRRVVNEEVENGVKRFSRILTKSPSFRIQAPEPPSTLQLIFSKKLSLPIFTNSKIVDIDNNPLQIYLVDTKGDGKVPVTPSYPIKLEIVVLDGDFASGDDHGENWTDSEFNKNVVKERSGKRPLLTGDLNVTMRDGYACVGEIEFTDNSSWIRSRKFRVGVRVVVNGNNNDHQGVKIRGAMTEAFKVKDHRGELYKKHHPPALGDEVWRLEKIGKEGAFHKKLSEAGVNTVQDLLKLSIVDPLKLREILGSGMSDKMWEVTLKHAKSCVMGNKFHILHGTNYSLMLNPICQVVKAIINGQTYPTRDLSGMHRAYIETLVRDAYANWNSLEEVDGSVNETPLSITQGDMVDHHQYHQNHHQQNAFITANGSSIDEEASLANNNQQIAADWLVNDAAYLCGPVDDTDLP